MPVTAQLLLGRTQFHLGKYKLLKFRGRGAMGIVFKAQHPDFDPTNPDHLNPATGLPNNITLRSPEVESEISSGSLYASGLIAAGGIVGLLGVAVRLYESATNKTIPRFTDTNPLHHDLVSVVMFALLAFSLYYFARKPLKSD